MQNTTREKILKKAQTIFNEEGYQHITMRRIANELNISVGNVTYHYKHKLDILKELMQNINLLEKNKHAESLSDLHIQIDKMIQSLIDSRFFFISDELANLNEEFARTNQANVTRLHQNLSEILEELTHLGLFTSSFTKTAQQAWIEMIMLAHLAWIRKLDLTQDLHLQTQNFLDLHWTLLIPYLSEEGLKQMKELF